MAMVELPAMDIIPTPSDAPRVLLIDLDNCPTQVNQLPQALLHFSRVIVCYGGFEPKIHLNQLGLLASALMEGRLAIESMERKGKNAADFGLTFWAGRLLAEMPPETEFLVLSQDTDLDYLMDMLRHAGRKVTRLDGNTYPNFGVTTPTQGTVSGNDIHRGSQTLLETAAEEYRVAHISGRHPRPARRVTLLNSIRSHFKGSIGIDPEAIVQELIHRGVLSMGRGGQVVYRDRTHQTPLPGSTGFPFVSPASVSIRTNDPTVEAAEMSTGDTNAMTSPMIEDAIGPADEYYAAHLVNQRGRPLRRATLLNSIRSYFKGQPNVDPEAVITELFHRGVVSQNRGGILRYHDYPISSLSGQSSPTLTQEAIASSLLVTESQSDQAPKVVSIPEDSTVPPEAVIPNELPDQEIDHEVAIDTISSPLTQEITLESAKIPIDTSGSVQDNQALVESKNQASTEKTKKSPRKRTSTSSSKPLSTTSKARPSPRRKKVEPVNESDLEINTPNLDTDEIPF